MVQTLSANSWRIRIATATDEITKLVQNSKHLSHSLGLQTPFVDYCLDLWLEIPKYANKFNSAATITYVQDAIGSFSRDNKNWPRIPNPQSTFEDRLHNILAVYDWFLEFQVWLQSTSNRQPVSVFLRQKYQKVARDINCFLQYSYNVEIGVKEDGLRFLVLIALPNKNLFYTSFEGTGIKLSQESARGHWGFRSLYLRRVFVHRKYTAAIGKVSTTSSQPFNKKVISDVSPLQTVHSDSEPDLWLQICPNLTNLQLFSTNTELLLACTKNNLFN